MPDISMSPMRFPVAVIFERTPVVNRWVSERWEPVAVVPPSADAPRNDAPVKVSHTPLATRWRFDGHAFELHPCEAEGYYLNLVAPEPKAFVMWRRADDNDPPVIPVIVTVSYNEAARMLDGGERVDAVPLPAGILAWMRPFVAEHYRPEPRKKVRRNDPFAADAIRRGRGPQG
jgi:hypothetical protein